MSRVIPIVVDVESDGPIPNKFSMVCFGAVVVDHNGLNNTFYGTTKPISETYLPDALKISGISREQHLTFPDPKVTMGEFAKWLASLKTNPDDSLSFWSDNPAYDWQFINYYFHMFYGTNPFGYSARRIGDLYAGVKGYAYASWKHLRQTCHSHNPVDDAKGNAEALLVIARMVKGLIK